MKLTFENYVRTESDGYPAGGQGLRVEWNDLAYKPTQTDPANVWFVMTTLAYICLLYTSPSPRD